jgi:hypothetical protein
MDPLQLLTIYDLRDAFALQREVRNELDETLVLGTVPTVIHVESLEAWGAENQNERGTISCTARSIRLFQSCIAVRTLAVLVCMSNFASLPSRTVQR